VDVLAYCSSSGIAHCDIKPSNLLLVKDDSKAGGVSLKISDFGTSINVSPESKNMQLIMKESAFTNFNKFMTPLYASPNII
jgi:serine/threonine protein kinase